MTVELSIIMPCLNERETLQTCIDKAKAFLARSGISGEIVIGDNGSTDRSQEIAQNCGARVIKVPLRGYGSAIYGAVLNARGKYCIVGDADDSYDFSNLESFVAELRAGADLVMGNRFLGGILPGAMPWKNRYIGNPVLSKIGQILFACPASDFHCGLRGFTRDAFLRMDLRTTGMEFASEMLIKATLLKMKIAEVATTLSPDGRSRPPHLRPYRDGWRHLRFMLLFSPNWLFLYPGLFLMFFGVSFGALLLSGPFQVGAVQFSIDSLIYCAAFIEIGFQAVLFSLLSRAFAIQEGLFPQPCQPSLFDRIFKLEYGILLGSTLLAIGFGLLGYALSIWSTRHFSSLDIAFISRIVIASSITLATGSEVVFSSFLLSMMRLNVRILSEDAREMEEAA